ncbi:MAG: metal-dependent hydrolase [Chitinophagaceae bacterium]|nr:metal-dependent hydrolase [Chitinophagaceae bacterium]
MDSLTHIALGACMGEAFAGKTVGKKAMLWGALAQSLPDIDFVAGTWLHTSDELLAHRGFTHSFLFCFLAAPIMAFFAERWHRPHNISFRKWWLFFGAAIFIHVFIDAFNNYGVGWFEPFSHQRISFNSVYVADPFLSVWPAIALAALLVLKRTNQRRRFWWAFGLALPALYLLYSLNNKRIIDTELKNSLQKQNISYTKYFSTPAPLQNWLWFVVAGTDSGYNVGYRSLYDKTENIHFTYFLRKDSLLTTVKNTKEVKQLVRFSQDFYTVEKWNDTVVFNDLRFGQIIGWQKPENHFVFHYFLDYPEANGIVVQRGRFAEWDKEVFRNFLRRIRGE